MSYVAGSELEPGATVAGYRIEALIGRGGMGAVYRAEEEHLAREVALKVIAPELARNEHFRERFLRESQIAASLDHPHVIPIYQAGEEGGLLYLTMRYVEGTDLAKLVAEEGALEPKRAVELLSQVAEALDAAHAKGLVHRDVKPSNVLVDEAGHAYLADFGLTRRLAEQAPGFEAGLSLGTPAYVAPEQIEGKEVDGRTDQYSLACLLHECLTGRPPFLRASEAAVLYAHLEEPPPSPHGLEDVIPRALAKDPAERYASCGEFLADARRALGLEPKRARWPLAVAGIGAALIGAALLAFVLTRGSGGLSSVSPNSVGVVDPGSNRLAAEVPVGIDPEAVAVGEGGVWVANVGDRTVSRIDPKETAARPRTISVDGYPSDIAVGRGAVWIALGSLAELVPITPDHERALRPVSALGEGRTCTSPRASLTVGAGAVWFVCETGGLGRVDLRTGKAARFGYEAGLLTSPSPVLPKFSDAAFGLGSLWIVNRARNTVVEVDPATSRYQREIRVGANPSAVAVGDGSVWVTNFDDDTVTRIEVGGPGQAVAHQPIAVGDGPVDVAVGEGGVWVVSRLDRRLTRIDPDTGKVVATIGIGNQPQRVAAGGGAVWVTVGAPEGQTSKRGGTVTIAADPEPACITPYIVACAGGPLFTFMDTLPRAVLPGAFEFGPDLTWKAQLVSRVDTSTKPPLRLTYHIRPEARWSDGVPVSAADFVFTYRTLVTHRAQLDILDQAVVGLIRSVRALDPKTVRVVFAMWDPIPWRGYLFRTVLPRHVLEGEDYLRVWRERIENPKTGEPIGSGPFLVSGWERGKQLTLVRNGRYWGPHAAYLDRVVLRFGLEGAPAAWLSSGTVDVAWGLWPTLGPEAIPSLRDVPGGRVRSRLAPRLEQVVINAWSGNRLLRKRLVRQALAYGVDRQAIVRELFGATLPKQQVARNGSYLNSSPYYRPHGSDRYRPAESRRLLQRAGCRRGTDGIFVCAGERLSLRFVTRGDVPSRVRTLELVRAQLRRAGIEVVPEFAWGDAVIGQYLASGDYDLLEYADLYWDPPDEYALTPAMCLSNFPGVAWTRYCRRVDPVELSRANHTLRGRERARAVNRVDAALAEEVAGLPLYWSPAIAASRTSLRGYVLHPLDPFWRAEEWSLAFER